MDDLVTALRSYALACIARSAMEREVHAAMQALYRTLDAAETAYYKALDDEAIPAGAEVDAAREEVVNAESALRDARIAGTHKDDFAHVNERAAFALLQLRFNAALRAQSAVPWRSIEAQLTAQFGALAELHWQAEGWHSGCFLILATIRDKPEKDDMPQVLHCQITQAFSESADTASLHENAARLLAALRVLLTH